MAIENNVSNDFFYLCSLIILTFSIAIYLVCESKVWMFIEQFRKVLFYSNFISNNLQSNDYPDIVFI